MTREQFRKKYPDKDSGGYPCKITYPTGSEFESQVVMCTGKALTVKELGDVLLPMFEKSLLFKGKRK